MDRAFAIFQVITLNAGADITYAMFGSELNVLDGEIHYLKIKANKCSYEDLQIIFPCFSEPVKFELVKTSPR